MKTHKYFSSLNILLDNIEGTNLLLEYFADFSRNIFQARDFKSIINIFYRELRKIYVNQNIEFVLWHNNQRLVKFIYNPQADKVMPIEEFTERNTIYNYVLEQQQTVLTNNYRQFCQNLGVSDCHLDASSWIGVPLVVRGKVLGMVSVWDDNPEHYLRLQDKQFLSAVSDMVSFAIENIYLYDYIVEKNGSYKIFETILPKGLHRNSLKNVIAHLLDSVLHQSHVKYSGIFLRSQFHNKWRLLSERFQEKELAQLGIDLIGGLFSVKDEVFNGQEYFFWHSQYVAHPLNNVFRERLAKYGLNAALVFPFRVEKFYYGVWVVAFHEKEEELSQEELHLYRFISYMLVQLIEKKALIERKNRYETYMKHLESMKIVGELASGSAHHLNNILSVILGKVQMLRKKLGNSQHLRDLVMIERAALDGAKTVKRLQSVSSKAGDSGERKPLNVNDLIQEVVEIVRPRFEREAQSRGITYDLRLNLGSIYPVMGDSTALREVLLNLVNNALDAMPQGGQLSIQTTLKEDNVLIFVSDTGVGIPPDVQDRIFEPFFTTKGDKGNGLGLSIAAEVISAHNGKIYVDSIPDKGSIFMIELPALKDQSLIEVESSAPTSRFDVKVLLVDDEGIVRETLAEMLEDEGCEVTVASGAEDALIKFQKYQCDVVLTDLSMPGINGYELAQRIKKVSPETPVLLITGWNQLDRKFMKSNKVIDGIIEKPFNMEQIRQQFNRVLRRNGKMQNTEMLSF